MEVRLWCGGGNTMADGNATTEAPWLAAIQRRGRGKYGGGVEVRLWHGSGGKMACGSGAA